MGWGSWGKPLFIGGWHGGGRAFLFLFADGSAEVEYRMVLHSLANEQNSGGPAVYRRNYFWTSTETERPLFIGPTRNHKFWRQFYDISLIEIYMY